MRGLAILGVLLYHALATLPGSFRQQFAGLERVAELGQYGVHLFFVLSGFLITGILLDSRERPDYYRRFFFRRALRIVPAYVLVIAGLKIAGAISWRYVAVCLLYLCNLAGLLGASNEYGPLWSLSVEEQFYLAWPFVVRHLRRRQLAILSVLLIFAIPALRYFLQFAPATFNDIRFKTWAVADFFAAGALLALFVRREPPFHRVLMWASLLCAAGGTAVVLVDTLLDQTTTAAQALALCPYVILFSGALLGAYAAPLRVTSSAIARVFAFFGDISYGLYLIHQYVFIRVQTFRDRLPHAQSLSNVVLSVALEFGIAIALATLSRRTFEAWFLSLKRPKPRSITSSK